MSVPVLSKPASADPIVKGGVAIGSLLLIVIGVAGWHWQAACVLAGSMGFAWAFVTSAKKPESKKKPE